MSKIGGTDINLPDIRGSQDELLKSVFAPVAEEIGKKLAEDYRKLHSDELSARETENLKRHTERVRERARIEPKEPTRKQRKRLIEWIDEASEADPDTAPEDAARWQAILEEILNRNDQTSLEALRSLNARDLRLIIHFSDLGEYVPSEDARRLISNGMVERLSPLDSPIFLINAAMLFVAAFLSIAPDVRGAISEFYGLGPEDFVLLDGRFALYLAILSMCLAIALSRAWIGISNRLRLTRLGLEVRGKIRKYAG